MKKARLRSLLCTLLLIAACNGSAPQLQEFSSESGGFVVSTPNALEENVESVDTAVGAIDIHTFTATHDRTVYVVAYSDYPAEIISQSDPQQVLNGSRDGAVQNVGGTLVSETAIDLEGNPGKALVINTTSDAGNMATVNAHLYLVENRLYQILVVVPQGAEKSAEVDTFLNSFSLSNAAP
jgi:hypothetical protein